MPGAATTSGQVAWKRWNTFLLLAASAHFALVYTLNTRPMLFMPAFEQGHEHAPFQYRALTAWIYAAADRFVHLPAALTSHLPPSMNSVDSFVTLLLSFASLLIAVIATRWALLRISGDETWSRWGALLVLPMGYFHYLLEFGHPCCTPLQLPYDLPSLAFFALAIGAIVNGRFLWLAVIFALGTINRESTIFIVILLWLYRSVSCCASTREWRKLYTEIALLCAVWLVVRAGLHRMYHPAAEISPAFGGFEIHVVDNLGYLLRPYYWTSFLSLFGFSWIFIYANWREVPDAAVRRMLWIGPVYLLAMYVVGVLSEIRIFGELIPVYVIALVLLLRRYLGSAGPRELTESVAP